MPPDYPQQPGQPQAPQQYPPQVVQPLPTQPSNYDFIMNSGQPAKPKGIKLPGGGGSRPQSIAIRIGLVTVGLIVLIIIFAIFKSLLVKGPDLTGYVGIAQDQQEIIHLVGNNSSADQQSLSASDQNFAATLNAVITSNQSQIVAYATKNGQKINTKVLNLKIHASLDTQLSNAQTAGTYDSAFQTAIQNELVVYSKDLASTYRASSGPNGRALLSKLYKQSQLLSSQASANSSNN